MEGKDPIKDLFSEKLSQLEVPVRPEIWSAVSSQIGAATGVAAGGLSIVSKIIIGVSVAASVSVGVYIATKDKEEVKDQKRTAQQSVETVKNNTTTLKDEETTQKKIVFDKIVELPKDLDFESVEDLELNDNLETRSFKDDQSDNAVEKDKIPELPPFNLVESKKEPEVVIQTNEKTDPRTSEVSETVLLEQSELELVLFNTFTPNNDGVNDILTVDAKGLTDFNLVVLDKNNKVVFQTNDPEFSWNGVGLNNEAVPAGKYVYYVTAKDSKGRSVSKYSPLDIIR